MNFKPNKYITTITKGKRNSWNALKKATSITNKGYQKNELNFQFHQYCTCDLVEERICNIIARLTYLGLMYHLHDLYIPQDMHSSQLTHICNREVL